MRDAAAGRLKIAARLLVNGEEADRRAVFGRHVPESGTVWHGQSRGAFAVVLDELPDHARLPQQFGDAQNQVGRGHPLAQSAVEVHAHHVGQQEVDRLAEHRRLGLDPADAPTEDPQPVDHGRMRVGAHQRVWIQHAVLFEDVVRQKLEVHLVADAKSRWDDPQAVKGLRSPFEEAVPLSVAVELHLHVEVECIIPAEVVDLHGVINHQIDRNQRPHHPDIETPARHRRAHRGQIDQKGHAGEILQQHATDDEWHLRCARRTGLPPDQRFNILLANAATVETSQH